MKRIFFSLLLLFSLTLSSLSRTSLAAAPEYAPPLDIGALSKSQHYSYVAAINNSNQVVENSSAGGFSVHAFLYTAGGGMQDPGTLPGSSYSYAGAINAMGQVAGDSEKGLSDHLFLWDSLHGMKDLGLPSGWTYTNVTGLNAPDQICGSRYSSGNFSSAASAFVYSDGPFRDLGIPVNYSSSSVTGVNTAGQTCGYVTNSNNMEASLHSSLGVLNASGYIRLPDRFSNGQPLAKAFLPIFDILGIRYYVKPKLSKPVSVYSIIGEANHSYGHISIRSVKEFFACVAEADAQLLQKTSVPVLLIHSSNDGLVKPESAHLVHKHLGSRHRQLHWVDAPHHELHLSRSSNQIMQLIGRFIATTS